MKDFPKAEFFGILTIDKVIKPRGVFYMCLSSIKVECKSDFVVANLQGEDVVMLKSGNTYEALDTGDLISVDNGFRKLTFKREEFPVSQLGVIH